MQIQVPPLPESVADATVATWHKQAGDAVAVGDILIDLETDKVVLEVPAATAGVLSSIAKAEGSVVTAGEVLGAIEDSAGGEAQVPVQPQAEAPAQPAAPAEPAATVAEAPAEPQEPAAEAPAQPTAPVQPAPEAPQPAVPVAQPAAPTTATPDMSPAVKRLVTENQGGASQAVPTAPVTPTTPASAAAPSTAKGREEKRVPMTRMRARIAERLLTVTQNTAMLTTFNEVDMTAIMSIRKKYKAEFEEKHGVKLGFMSLFTKAVVEALRKFPQVNASLDGDDVVYHGFYDVGIAVSTEKGLVVPIVRDADHLSLADIETQVSTFAKKAREGKITLEDMTGGTFTITNGGVFGSLLSTPILNSPQSAILGMHTIQQRPMAVDGQVKILPMMYLALSYDHRIVDGREAVQFLVTIKEFLEDPARLLLE